MKETEEKIPAGEHYSLAWNEAANLQADEAEAEVIEHIRQRAERNKSLLLGVA